MNTLSVGWPGMSGRPSPGYGMLPGGSGQTTPVGDGGRYGDLPGAGGGRGATGWNAGGTGGAGRGAGGGGGGVQVNACLVGRVQDYAVLAHMMPKLVHPCPQRCCCYMSTLSLSSRRLRGPPGPAARPPAAAPPGARADSTCSPSEAPRGVGGVQTMTIVPSSLSLSLSLPPAAAPGSRVARSS